MPLHSAPPTLPEGVAKPLGVRLHLPCQNWVVLHWCVAKKRDGSKAMRSVPPRGSGWVCCPNKIAGQNQILSAL